MVEHLTACPRNCYSTCSFIVQSENNRIIRILPYRKNLATPEGPCIKGLSYIERASSPERLIHPLIRTENGKFKEISMENALQIIAEKLSYIRGKYGPKSVFWYRGSGISGLTNEIGTAFWKLYGGVTLTYGNLCWPAGLEAVRLTMGSVRHNVPWDIENARTIIIWGKNPAETNIQEMAFIASAREKGSRVIVIDVRRTPTADKSDMLICPRPGTDGALALGIAYFLDKEDLIDTKFINEKVIGYELYRQKSLLDPEKASSLTGIPVPVIHDLALCIGSEGPVTIIPGYGLQRHMNGGQTIRSILSLAIITGNIGKPGAGFNYANLQGYVFDKIKEPLSYYPDPVNDLPFRRSVSMANAGNDILSASDPVLKAAWIERGNPAIQSPDSGNVRKALESLEFKVVVDQFKTDTADLADIILPAKDIFDQPDIISSYWSPYIQYKPAILKPDGEIIPESEIYYKLAQKMGMSADEDQIPRPGNENIEIWLGNRIKGYTGLTLEDLKKEPVIAPDLEEIAYRDSSFGTPSGRIELFSEQCTQKWGVSPLPDFDPVIKNIEQEKYPLRLLTPNAGNRIHSQFGNLKIIREVTPIAGIELSPGDAEERGLHDGDTVRIFNERGEFKSIASVTNRLPSGIVCVPNGLWMNENGGSNILISGDRTDMGFGAAFHDTMVEVGKMSG